MTLKIVVDDGSARANRDELRADGDFEVEIVNRGQPTHVTVDVKGEAGDKVGVVDDAVFVGDRESVGVNVGVVDEEVEGLLEVSAGFDSGASKTVLSLEPSNQDALEADPAYERSGAEVHEGEPRVDLLVAGVVGFALVAVILFAALFGQWAIAMVVSVVAAFGVAIMWLFKNYDTIGSPTSEPEGETED